MGTFLATDTIGGDRHVGRGFRADVVGLGEGDIAMVLEDKPVESGGSVSASVGQRAFIDRLDLRAAEVRRSRKRKEMHDPGDCNPRANWKRSV